MRNCLIVMTFLEILETTNIGEFVSLWCHFLQNVTIKAQLNNNWGEIALNYQHFWYWETTRVWIKNNFAFANQPAYPTILSKLCTITLGSKSKVWVPGSGSQKSRCIKTRLNLGSGPRTQDPISVPKVDKSF